MSKKQKITMGYLALIYALILFFTLGNSLGGYFARGYDHWNFVYMFTNQSNIFVFLWLIGFGISCFWENSPVKKFVNNRTVITAVTVYISITFFIVATVLEPFYKGEFEPTNSLFHHFLSAIVMWLYFFFVKGEGDTRYRTALYILIYPICFLFVNLLVGGLVNYTEGTDAAWAGQPAYAYGFINPGNYPNVFIFGCVMIALVAIFAAFGLLLIKLKRYLVKIDDEITA